MTRLVWDAVGERFYETGVDRGVLYVPDSAGNYENGYAWNGLTNVQETPTGAEASAQYADNQKYLNLYSAEEFGATLEAFTWPDEFNQFDGVVEPEAGVYVGQQNRGVFGLSYRTLIGNDQDGNAHGSKLHLVYGCQASPSDKGYSTVNDSPEPINFSWEIETTPVAVTLGGEEKVTALLTIDSRTADPTGWTALQDMLWGTAGTDPRLPLPNDVIALFTGTATLATPTEPTFNGTDEITIPTVTGVEYYDEATLVPAGVYTITEDTVITARPATGYYFPDPVADEWYYVHV